MISLKSLKEFLKRNEFVSTRKTKKEVNVSIVTDQFVKELGDGTKLAVEFNKIGKGRVRVSILKYSKEFKKFVWAKDSKGEVLYDLCPEFVRDFLVSTYKEISI